MKERPILFGGEMVRAIQEDHKTMTRRLRGLERINERPDDHAKAIRLTADGSWSFWYPGKVRQEFVDKAYPQGGGFKCPYGVPGDRLWVRETWACGKTDGLVPVPVYRADGELSHHDGSPIKWTPSIFMPRWASRILLEITNERPERVQEITEEDARKEGCYTAIHFPTVPMFVGLWDTIYGAGAWQRNDWVWAIEFKRI